MKISIITINYNGSENTIKLLKSLQEQTDSNFQVIVVDNASEKTDFDQLSNFINEATCDVTLFKNEKNLGFSGGNNVGIKEALRQSSEQDHQNSLEWVLLLNNDTWAKPGFISSLRSILAQKEGIVGIPLNAGKQTAYCGEVEWLKPTLQHQLSTVNCQLSTAYVIGGAMAIHKSVFDRIGFLDEKYFLYFEDADYTIRGRKAGIPISIASNIIVYHNVSSSTKKLGSSLLLRYHYRNALYFNLKNGPWYIKILVWLWSWWIIIKQILKIMMYRNREQSLAILRGVLDFYTNKFGKINT